MTNKYSYKQGKKKKAQAHQAAETPLMVTQTATVSPAAIIPVTQAPARVEKRETVTLNLRAELKRVGVLGGVMLVVLVAASLLLS